MGQAADEGRNGGPGETPSPGHGGERHAPSTSGDSTGRAPRGRRHTGAGGVGSRGLRALRDRARRGRGRSAADASSPAGDDAPSGRETGTAHGGPGPGSPGGAAGAARAAEGTGGGIRPDTHIPAHGADSPADGSAGPDAPPGPHAPPGTGPGRTGTHGRRSGPAVPDGSRARDGDPGEPGTTSGAAGGGSGDPDGRDSGTGATGDSPDGRHSRADITGDGPDRGDNGSGATGDSPDRRHSGTRATGDSPGGRDSGTGAVGGGSGGRESGLGASGDGPPESGGGPGGLGPGDPLGEGRRGIGRRRVLLAGTAAVGLGVLGLATKQELQRWWWQVPGNEKPRVAGQVDDARARWVAAADGNMRRGDRPSDFRIDRVIIHVTQGSAASAVKVFRDPAHRAAAHYIVCRDGQIIQMIRELDVAFHAANREYNERSIGIEHEGWIDRPQDFTEEMYRSSAKLTAGICDRYGFPADRKHIIGHNEVPGADHTDPGRHWDWDKYLRLVRAQLKTESTSGDH